MKTEAQRLRDELMSLREKLKVFHSQKLTADKKSTELLAANSKLEVSTLLNALEMTETLSFRLIYSCFSLRQLRRHWKISDSSTTSWSWNKKS
jgi:hypothetical protein